MTPIVLMDALERFVRDTTKEIILPAKIEDEKNKIKYRPADVYKYALPIPEDATGPAPYILLCFLSGADDHQPGAQAENTALVRAIVVTWERDASEGRQNTLNIITRLRTELLKLVGLGPFALERPLEYLLYEDNTYPYHIGELITRWELPDITPEVQKEWQ